jgi:hypothetical protein
VIGFGFRYVTTDEVTALGWAMAQLVVVLMLAVEAVGAWDN